MQQKNYHKNFECRASIKYCGSVNGLREFRKKADLRQRKLSELVKEKTGISISQGMISAHENDRKHITDLKTLKAIADELSCRPADIAHIMEDANTLEVFNLSEFAILSAIRSPSKRNKVAKILDIARMELTE
jgi:hypothetical protein